MDKLLVASEYTEPSFLVDEVISKINYEDCGEANVGLLLITKNIEGSTPIYTYARSLNIPTVVHATITTLGGTAYEPKVPTWQQSLIMLKDFMRLVDDRLNIVLRIDPIIPRATNFEMDINPLISSAARLGIGRCRFSIIDYYPFVIRKLKEAGQAAPWESFNPPPDEMEYIRKSMIDICNRWGMTLESCAENLRGVRRVGCADKEEWLRLGLAMPSPIRKQRATCFCDVEKNDLLPHWKTCGYNCLYCYWGKYRK